MDVEGRETPYRVRLDVPLDEREACDRGLPRNIARLIIARRSGATPAQDMVPLFAEWMMRWRASGETIFVTPITAFVSDNRIGALVGRLGINHMLARPEHLFAVDEVGQLTGLLQDLKCEEAVIFYAKGVGMALQTLRAVVEFDGPYSCNSAPFLSRLAEHGAFGFYAESHGSLEILGDARFVCRRCSGELIQELAQTVPDAPSQ